MTVITIIGLVVVIVLEFVAIIALAYELGQFRHRAANAEEHAQAKAEEWIKVATKDIRANAVKRSHAVMKGKVYEHLVPFGEEFGYDPRDVRFLGSPIDFIVFEGLSDGCVDRIVFIEVKTGLSRLSKRERQIREAIDAAEVDFEEVRYGKYLPE